MRKPVLQRHPFLF